MTASVAAPVVPPFAVVPGRQVKEVLHGRERAVTEVVEATYRLHAAGRTVNPPSSFLRFTDRPASRIIALAASLGGDGTRVDGLKWIASFPANVRSGIPGPRPCSSSTTPSPATPSPAWRARSSAPPGLPRPRRRRPTGSAGDGRAPPASDSSAPA